MKESDIEGVAIRDGAESCVGVREGVGEALTGARVGGAIEPRDPWSRGADAVVKVEGNTGSGVIAGRCRAPRGRRSQARTTSSIRENGEVPWLSVPVVDAPPFVVRGVACRSGRGPQGERRGGDPLMHDRGKSDGLVVPAKPPNNAEFSAAEVVEERRPAEGNAASKRTPDTEPGQVRAVRLIACARRRGRA
jgi:hypothetical protein